MNETGRANTGADQPLAALDLGSNSFHMVIGRLDQGEVRLQDSLSEKVRLAEGLDQEGRHITEAAMERALDCLARFGQRLRDIPRAQVRVVGTNALRMADNAPEFIARAEALLGHRVQVVNGREEARLIYLGVAHALADDADRRLVVDIGGGSTELIIGERFEARETESLHMGCISYAQQFFPDGAITAERLEAAVTATRQQVLAIDANFRASGWHHSVGASGTVKTIARVCERNQWSNGGINRHGLDRIEAHLLEVGHVDRLSLKGLSADRHFIFPAGVAILRGLFTQFGLDSMAVSGGALREGLLYDLLGRFRHEDVRERSIAAMVRRYQVDADQGRRVAQTAENLRRHVARVWQLDGRFETELLRWAAQLQELGLTVSHSQFHKHGHYLLRCSDMAGFSRQEQQSLATLVRGHRRKLPLAVLDDWPASARQTLLRLCLLLRLAVQLHHSRRDDCPADLQAEGHDTGLWLRFPPGWLDARPLTRANLVQEQAYWRAADYDLTLSD